MVCKVDHATIAMLVHGRLTELDLPTELVSVVIIGDFALFLEHCQEETLADCHVRSVLHVLGLGYIDYANPFVRHWVSSLK